MKVLFAISNDDNVSSSIIKRYQQKYKEIITSKNVYYFNAIIKELQKDKSYDAVVIGEDLEPISNNNYDTIDKFIFEKLDNISDEAYKTSGDDIPIILICSDRRTKSDGLLIKLFGIGIYNALLGNDRNIDAVCDLINKPRSKKEAKSYYKIESEDVNYKPEREAEVSENEIQNILAHYKKIGNNDKKCIESFNSIAEQYNDTQLRIIVKFLPLNVKAILETGSERYQKLMTGGTVLSNGKYNKYEKINKSSQNNNMDFLTKDLEKPKLTKPVVIPTTMDINNSNNQNINQVNNQMQTKINTIPNVQIQKQETLNQIKNQQTQSLTSQEQMSQIQKTTVEPQINQEQMPKIPPEIKNSEQQMANQNISKPQEVVKPVEEVKIMGENNINKEQEIKVEQQPKRRGRPRKVITEEMKAEQQAPKRGRGRPRKVDVEQQQAQAQAKKEEPLNLFGLDNRIPPLQEANLFAMSDERERMVQNPYNNFSNGYINQTTTPIQETKPVENINRIQNNVQREEALKVNRPNNVVQSSFIARNCKLISFVGTSKNGTSFIVNNLAELLAQKGINTAILDLTKNKNSYYMYTDNNQGLMQTATNSIRNLARGTASGVNVNKNLTVFTSLPGDDQELENIDTILQTLDNNYSAVLMDCDFDTNINYFVKSTEMYLVQSMDALTIQPLTLFLSELKLKNALNESKLRVIINKEMKLKILNDKLILGGMSKYNEPSMTLQRDLFNPATMKYAIVPFEEQTYARYIEAIAACKVSLSGYSEKFMESLNELANMVYPLLPGGKGSNNEAPKRGLFGSRDKAQEQRDFSSGVNGTLDKMRTNY